MIEPGRMNVLLGCHICAPPRPWWKRVNSHNIDLLDEPQSWDCFRWRPFRASSRSSLAVLLYLCLFIHFPPSRPRSLSNLSVLRRWSTWDLGAHIEARKGALHIAQRTSHIAAHHSHHFHRPRCSQEGKERAECGGFGRGYIICLWCRPPVHLTYPFLLSLLLFGLRVVDNATLVHPPATSLPHRRLTPPA